MIVAVKNLVAERARFVLSVIGVAVAVILVLVMSGIFVGTTQQVTTYIDHSKGAVWVVQPGVTQMFRAVSWLPGDAKGQLQNVPGVRSTDPILGLPSDFVHNGGHTAYFVVGYDTGTGVGGPWSLSEGRNVAGSGEVVLDRVLAKKNKIHVGDTVQLVDGDFTVVGLSNQTAAVGNFYAFISLPDAAHLLRAGNRVSYFLVQPADGFTADQVATSVREQVPGADALTSATFAENSRAIVISMIGRPLKTMIGIAALVGVALVGLTVLAVTTEQMSDFGVLRALGVRPGQLCRTVITQAVLIAGLGYLVGAGITYGVQFLVKDRLGDVTVEVTPTMLLAMAAATGAMAIIGSLIPVRRVTRIDPAQAFRR
ncbi:FtsX-like permease family protein [Mycobacterium sp. CBMA271]|uniref:ABC transporter permease n=1 Tax=unclassified Mycobacteroides TaxID=2618759 RepID=UPI0013293C01|nr:MULTISPECIES: ABC transporter permease [unclassified Mycobacteroides]MUM19263.1 ABC transporter permease [Mycobacteroides sp. CBMA 326]MUM21677.1 FtsX-like permease family protein [Mycobacteroides sp. CBMA 271]